MPGTIIGPAQVTIVASSLPSGFCPTSEDNRLIEYAKRLTGSLPGNYSAVNFGNIPPSATDRDKLWARTNFDGTPDRIYTFANGSWKSAHPLVPGMVMLWWGALADIAALDGGSGVLSQTTGPFWEEVTEANGRFVIHPGTTPVTATVIANRATGGEERVTLTEGELPAHNHPLNLGAFPSNSVIHTTGGKDNIVAQTGSLLSANKGLGQSHNNMPQYLAMYYIRRTIRQYYNIA